jgi:hypothetical protein
MGTVQSFCFGESDAQASLLPGKRRAIKNHSGGSSTSSRSSNGVPPQRSHPQV